jgi:hypothetical protein
VFPETGYLVHDWTYDAWLDHGRKHVQANRLKGYERLEEKFEDQLCRTLDPSWCTYDPLGRPRVSASLDWDSVQNGLGTFARWFASGFKVVEKAEAERRALICGRCYLNVHVAGCPGCHQLASAITLKHSTRYDSSLKGCAVCKCLLRAKVHVPISILDTYAPGVQSLYPNHCWLNKESENYRA